MTAEPRTIEQMIAEWYASGTCSDECAHEIVRQTTLIAAGVVRTYSARIADQVRHGAPGHVTQILQKGVQSKGVSDSAYDPKQPFAGWCYTIIQNFAIDRHRRKWTRHEKLRSRGQESDPLPDTPDRPRPPRMAESDREVVITGMLAEYEQLLPRPVDRIIVAVQTGFIDGLSDAVVTRWCEEANLAVEVAALRRLVDQVGCLKALATVLNMSYDVVRARASRAMRDLRAGDFRRAREEFEQ